MQVEVEISGNVGTITLNRPEARTSSEVTRLLDEAIVDLDRREEVRAIILTGADPAFCAGFDLRTLATELHSVAERQQASTFVHLGLMPAHHTPIIGAINGDAVTGGLELAMSSTFSSPRTVPASSIASIPAENVREVRRVYDVVAHLRGTDAWTAEASASREWMEQRFNQARLDDQRSAIIARGKNRTDM